MKTSVLILFIFISSSASAIASYLSPAAMRYLVSKNLLIIAQKTANQIDLVDTKNFRRRNSIKLEQSPTGMCISSNMKLLFVTTGESNGMLTIIDLASKKIKSVIKIGHSPCCPALASKDVLAFCNRFANQVSFMDLQSSKIIKALSVGREPISIDLDEKHKQLIVAHHLPDDASTSGNVSSKISFIDTERMQLIKHVSMPNGSSSLKQIKVAPGGRYAVVSHILARYTIPPTQLEQGWQNANAITLIDLEKQNIYHTVLLDDVKHGAANPWGVEFDKDGKTLFVTHAGTGELSVIDFQNILEKLKKYPVSPGHYSQLTDPSNNLSFVRDCRLRFGLKGEGSRSLAVGSTTLFVGQYFSDAIEIVDLKNIKKPSRLILLNKIKPDQTRKGEMLFHSAKMCFENWQSCSSCHPEGRVDGFNWDLLNDGIGNPKNTRSLLNSHRTPPVMSTGARESAEIAVRSGMTHILFMDKNENNALAIDAFLMSMKPVPSPYLVDEKLSESAQRGKRIFETRNCTQCHSGPYLTDRQPYDVGTTSKFDVEVGSANQPVPHMFFYTPTLMELWRTAPYLHDGRYYTLEELFDKGSHKGIKDGIEGLGENEVRALINYLKSI